MLVPAFVFCISATKAVKSSRAKFGVLRSSASRIHAQTDRRPGSDCNRPTARSKARKPVATTPNVLSWARTHISACFMTAQYSPTKHSAVTATPASLRSFSRVKATLAHGSPRRSFASQPFPTRYLLPITHFIGRSFNPSWVTCSKTCALRSRASVTHREMVVAFFGPSTCTSALCAACQSLPHRS